MDDSKPTGRNRELSARLPILDDGGGEWVGPISDEEYDLTILQLGGVDGAVDSLEDDDLHVVYRTEDALGEDLPVPGGALPILAVVDPSGPNATCYRLNPSPELLAVMPCDGSSVSGACDGRSTAYRRGEFFCPLHQHDRLA